MSSLLRLKAFLRIYLPTLVAILVIQLIFHLFFFQFGFYQLLTALISTIGTVTLLAIPIVIIYLIFYKVSITLCNLASTAFFLCMLILHTLLWAYQAETGILLGADLYGYNWQDIRITLAASASIPWLGVLLFSTSIIGLLYGIYRLKSDQVAIPNLLVFSYLSVVIVSFIYVGLARLDLIPDKWVFPRQATSYFLTESYVYMLEQQADNQPPAGSEDLPFLHAFPTVNPLAEYLKQDTITPNIVFITVEGLGADFVGNKAKYGGFMPYLDSLSKVSLYWENTLSNTGRTFGVLPTILGSLPYQKAGFMDYGINMPDHQTLFSLLHDAGYHTAFYYGGNANFDGQDVFLEQQKTDYILTQEKFPNSYQKMAANNEGFSWGYSDKAVFEYAFDQEKKHKDKPFTSFYMTLTTHEPFKVPEQSYVQKVQQMIDEMPKRSKQHSKTIQQYKNVFECLNYTDDAVRQLMQSYQQLESYQHTIFIITGDHRLIPIPTEHQLERFHVPLMIYSPMQQKAETFEVMASHSQLAPSLLSYLKYNFNIPMPDSVSFISEPLSTETSFGSTLDLPLMINKNQLTTYIQKEHVLLDNRLYQLKPNFRLQITENQATKSILQNALELYKKKANTALEQNKLLHKNSIELNRLPNDLIKEKLGNQAIDFLKSQKLFALSPDSLLLAAKAFIDKNEITSARTTLYYALSKAPNYHDLRVLLARTYGWNNQYDTAYFHLEETLKRAGQYEDAYIAYADFAFWSEAYPLSEKMAQAGLSYYPASSALALRLARVEIQQQKITSANQRIKSVLAAEPENEMALQLKARIDQL